MVAAAAFQDYSYPSHTGEGMIQARLYRPEARGERHQTIAGHVTGQPVPLPLVQIIHGMAEHMHRYDPFCRYLASLGFTVCIQDLAGHGLSAVNQERLGCFGEQDSVEQILDDIQETLDQARSILAQDHVGQSPDGWILLGHSMGSFIARMFCTRPQPDLRAVVFSGTAGPNPAYSLGILLANLSIKMRGPLYRDPFLARLTSGGNLKRLKPARTSFDWLTRDDMIVDAYIADPLCGYDFTAAGYRDLFTLMKRMSHTRWAHSLPENLPILLVSGEEDPIGEFGKGPKAVHQSLLASGRRAFLRLYAGGRHEMLNEINRAEVWQDLADWMRNPSGEFDGRFVSGQKQVGVEN